MTSWVAVDTRIGDNPKTAEFAERLAISTATAVGHLTMILGNIADHRPSGGLSGVGPRIIAQWGMWTGDAEQFSALWREMYVDANGKVHDWDEWNGKFLEARLRERDRGRERREKERLQRERARQESNGPSKDDPRLRRGRSTGTGPDPTLPTEEAEPLRGSGVDRPKAKRKTPERLTYVQECVELWQTYKGHISYGRMGKALKPLVESGLAKLEQIPPQFKKYLAENVDGDFCSPEKFASRWHDHVAGRSSRGRGESSRPCVTDQVTIPSPGQKERTPVERPHSILDVVAQIDRELAAHQAKGDE